MNENAKKAEQILHEKMKEAPIPWGRPAPGASSWRTCFKQHILSAIRSNRADYEAAANAALRAWEKDQDVRSAILDEQWKNILQEKRAIERVRRTSPTSFELVKADAWDEDASAEEVLGEITEPPRDVHEVRQKMRSLR